MGFSRRMFLASIMFGMMLPAQRLNAQIIIGAGASFPFTIYTQWAYLYNQQTGHRLNYQSIGSGGGIAQIRARTVDFGASDTPLSSEELRRDSLVQFPMIIGGIVPVVNLEGVNPGTLKLTPNVLSHIFLGDITSWNDARITRLNPGITLPDRGITVVHRADGSGTTWLFSTYLDLICEHWHSRVGAGKTVSWPVGVGGKGNEGVAAFVQRIKGSIGYVEYSYIFLCQMNSVQLENRDGQFIPPTSASFYQAALNANWNTGDDFYTNLVNRPGKGTWPITGASFILMPRETPVSERTSLLLDFFNWCYHDGAQAARDLHYVPIPDPVVSLVRSYWQRHFGHQSDVGNDLGAAR